MYVHVFIYMYVYKIDHRMSAGGNMSVCFYNPFSDLFHPNNNNSLA